MRSFRPKELRSAIAVFALAIAGLCNSSGENKMKFSRVEYLISEMMGPPETLVIEGDGSATYESHTNRRESGAVAVGTFATKLESGEIAKLAAALMDPTFRALPDHWGQIAAGERYKTIRVMAETETVEKRIGNKAAVHPRLLAILETLDRIVGEVQRYPMRNLQLKLSDTQWKSDGAFTGVITLSNPGSASVTCANPSALRAARGGRLALRGWPDRQRSGIHSTDMLEANIVDVVPEDASSVGELLEIPPGGAISFRIKAALPRSRERGHVVQALYQNTATERVGREVMIVELYSPLVKIQ